ncbi:MAG TPA: hypothetical protein VHV50_03675 [Actinomycetota bacterium]|nr:hypothetical protein [Actinomycetota bacterium]
MPVDTGHEVSTITRAKELAPWGALEAAGFLILGSLSPWVSATPIGSFGVIGTPGGAKFTFVLGLIVAGMAAIHLTGYLDRKVAMWGVIAASAAAGMTSIYEVIHLHSHLASINANSAGHASIGNGLYLTCLAAAVAIGTGILMRGGAATSTSPQGTLFDGEVPAPAV